MVVHSSLPLSSLPLSPSLPLIPSFPLHTHARAGTIERQFMAVPDGATWVDVVIRAGDNWGDDADGAGGDGGANKRLFILHLIQLQPHRTNRSIDCDEWFRMGAGESKTFSCAVVGGLTLELCVAQFWSSLGESSLSVEASFHGLVPNQAAAALSAGQSATRVLLRAAPTSCQASERVKPDGKLDTWREAIRAEPVLGGGSAIRILDGARDALDKGRQVYALELSYKFTQLAKGKVTPMVPLLNNLLYDSPFSCGLMLIFDDGNRQVGVVDAFPEAITLGPGTYTLRLQVRHDSPAALAPLSDTVLLLARPLAKKIDVKAFVSQRAAAAGDTQVGTVVLKRGDTMAVYVEREYKSLKSLGKEIAFNIQCVARNIYTEK